MLCAKVNDVQASGAPEAAQLVSYCANKAPPEFASSSEPDRLAALLRLSQAAGLPAPDLTPIQRSPSPSRLIEYAAQGLVSDQELETGAAGNNLVAQAWAALCHETEVEAWLPSLCAPLPSDQGLLELRRRVVRDLAAIPASAVEKNAPAMPRSARDSLSMASALLDTLTQSLELYHLAKRLAHDTVSDVKDAARNPCAANEPEPGLRRQGDFAQLAPASRALLGQTSPPLSAPYGPERDPMVVASRVLVRLLQDGPALDRSVNYYVSVLEKEYGRAMGNSAFRLEPFQRTAATSLVAAVRTAIEAQQRVARSADPRRDLVALARAFSSVVQHAVSMSANRPMAPPAQVVEMVDALVRQRLDAAIDAVVSMTPEPAVPQKTLSTLRKAVRIASIRSGSDARRVMMDALIPIGPWSERYLFEVNGGALRLKDGDFAVAADGGFGYNADGWGGMLRGSIGRYHLIVPQQVRSTTTQGGGAVDAWLLAADSGVWRLEGRLAAGVHSYRTENFAQASDSRLLYSKEDSTIGRGQLLVGARARPGHGLAIGLWLGGGIQYERYRPLEMQQAGGQIDLVDENKVSAAFTGRVRAQFALVPGWLAIRVRGDGSVFRMTRNSLAIGLHGAELSANLMREEFTQTDISGRLFVDGEVLQFWRFVPSLFGGLDYVRLKSSEETNATAVPVFGIGIRRDAF